jgi:hypothetical protein
MRNRVVITALFAVSASLSGCTIVHRVAQDELHYPGGLAGKLADQHYIVSARDSKELQLYRYALALAVFSRAATANVRSGKEAAAFLSNVQDAVDEINYSAGHLYAVDNGPPPCTTAQALSSTGGNCEEYRANFESDLPLIEHKMLNVAFGALPKEQAVTLYNSALKLDPLATGRAFIGLAARSLLIFHRAAAVHRTNLELLAGVVGGPDDQDATVLNAHCYFQDHSGHHAKTDDACAGVAKGTGDFKQKPITIDAFKPILAVVKSSCLLLPVDATGGEEADPLGARKTVCAKLAFAPKRRLDLLAPKKPAAAPQPAAAGAGLAATPQK